LTRLILARKPKVKGGVETTVVSPAVRRLLDAKAIPFATEVTFELLDDRGQVTLKGRFDVVFRTPETQQLIFPELKGDKLEALTKGQKVYVPLFESKDGAQVRVTGKGGGRLHLPVGHVERVHGENFFRVGSRNLNDFTGFVEQASTGKKATNVYYDRGKLQAFHSQAEFDEFLVREKGLVVDKAPAKPPVSATDKPLKPPKPPATPPPNPLHDPPGGRKPPSSGWDPIEGPPQHGRKRPNYEPAPMDKPPKPPSVPAKAPAAPPASKVGTETVEELVSHGKLHTRVAAKIGKAALTLIDGLMPDPTDAIMMMIEYALSFEAAKEAIRQRNLEKGFAIGWACYLLFPMWERARTFARTHVEKNVITLIIDAVGVAENAYNEGLVRGFLYAERFSTTQTNRVRQLTLDAVHRSGQTVAGHYLGDGVYQFVRDDVYLFAAALRRATRDVLEESERRKYYRENRDRLEQIASEHEMHMARK
jgi:hypothetical protein